MIKRLDKKTYRKLIKQLKTLAPTGTVIKFERRPVSRVEGAPKSAAFGSYHAETKIAKVCRYGRPARWQTLLVLAHEIRHAQHQAEGLYSGYYRKDLYLLSRWLFKKGKRPKKIPLIDLEEAHRAELDCDRYAYEWLAENDLSFTRDREYAFSDTFAYQLHAALRQKFPGGV